MLQQKLKEATQTQHDQLEELMFVKNIMGKNLTQDQYRQILVTNYVTHLVYEDSIHHAINKEKATQLNLAARYKLPALKLDLEEAVIDPKTLAEKFHTLNNIIEFDEATALGAMYVLEGATMGGAVIVKQLRLNPNFTEDFKFNYYNIYKENLMPNWKSFVATLNELPEEEHQKALNGALYMFEAIANIAQKVKEI
ncbi:MAG: hypothetical protein EOO47_03790 [Flavobacterium sp.]|nr:MAG: hypothetical protein EOO47_03790 [Flavobacterium sp.]